MDNNPQTVTSKNLQEITPAPVSANCTANNGLKRAVHCSEHERVVILSQHERTNIVFILFGLNTKVEGRRSFTLEAISCH